MSPLSVVKEINEYWRGWCLLGASLKDEHLSSIPQPHFFFNLLSIKQNYGEKDQERAVSRLSNREFSPSHSNQHFLIAFESTKSCDFGHA